MNRPGNRRLAFPIRTLPEWSGALVRQRFVEKRVRLKDVLSRANLRAETVEIVVNGADCQCS